MASSDPVSPSARVSADGRGVLVPVRLTPKAGHNRIDGVVIDGKGNARLKVRVSVAPEGGKANAALIELLAKAWRLPKSAISIAAGSKARTKTVLVTGQPAAILERIAKGGAKA